MEVSNHCLDRFALVSQADVLIIIKLHEMKSCDLDPLPATLLSQCIELLFLAITDITNDDTLECGVSLSALKSA